MGPAAGLKALRLGLSGVRSLALDLPQLAALDLNGAGELRCLELRCPLLLTAFFQACRCAPPATLASSPRSLQLPGGPQRTVLVWGLPAVRSLCVSLLASAWLLHTLASQPGTADMHLTAVCFLASSRQDMLCLRSRASTLAISGG